MMEALPKMLPFWGRRKTEQYSLRAKRPNIWLLVLMTSARDAWQEKRRNVNRLERECCTEHPPLWQLMKTRYHSIGRHVKGSTAGKTRKLNIKKGYYVVRDYIDKLECISGIRRIRRWDIQHIGTGHRRKFTSQTSDNMERWKAEQGRGREKRKIRRKKSRRERVRRQKMQMREKVGKSRNTVFFQWFGAPEGRKVGSLKRRVRSQLARWEMKKCTPLWLEAHFEVKTYKTPQRRTTFGSWDVEKAHAVVARSTFRSQNAQNTPASDHFWQLRCRKSARRCGAKHISKSKCTKHTRSGPLLAVEMSKKRTPLWREAHFQVKMHKTQHVRATFGGSDVEKVHAVVARSTFRSQNVQNTTCSRHFWKFGCWKSARRCGAKHISKSKCTKYTSVGPLLEVEMSKKWTKCTKH